MKKQVTMALAVLRKPKALPSRIEASEARATLLVGLHKVPRDDQQRWLCTAYQALRRHVGHADLLVLLAITSSPAG